MKVMLSIILILVSMRAYSPAYPQLYIAQSEGIDPFQPLRFAIGMVECSLDTLAYNPVEKAAGYFQIRPIRLNDYYARTGIRYSTRDMFDYEKAEEVFMYYATKIGPYDFCRIAREWNGSGPKTWEYWKKVRIYLII